MKSLAAVEILVIFGKDSIRLSTAELKKKLTGKIADSEDESLLLEVYRLLQIEGGDVDIYQLTDDKIQLYRIASWSKEGQIYYRWWCR